ncbi:MAG: hypothetical protein JNK11_15225, partial [Alphaproteobacteria bacterium]|nr:hypothetical protein [Alphaproteobacteria bacterium]
MHRFLSRAAAAAALAVALAVPAAPALAQAVEWKFFTYFAPNDTPTTLHKGLAEDITKASGGRLKVTVFASGELPYKAQDVLRVLATNQVQMGDLATGPVAAEAPELNVYSIPFVCSSFDGFFKSVAEAAPTVDEVL